MPANTKIKKRYRSAVTGKFVSPAYAKRHPQKVVGEKVKKPHKCDPKGDYYYD